MIRINLLKNNIEKRAVDRQVVGKILIIGGIAMLAGICIFGGTYVYRFYMAHRKVTLQEEKQIAPKGPLPSTYSHANMVEEVVKEVNDSRLKLKESGVLDLPYDQLSFSERINYEFLFMKNICEMLARIIPASVGIKSMEIDNFQTVYAVGLGPTRDIIQDMLVSLKNERVTVLTPPYSFIKSDGKEGFRFAFSCKTNFGLDFADPFVDGSLARLPSRAALPELIDRFVMLAKQNHITITKKISQTSSEKVGGYYRLLCQWSGAASYKNFVQFVISLYDAKFMGAIKRCSLTAKTSSSIEIESQLVVTAKE